jgi:hypothetical protein
MSLEVLFLLYRIQPYYFKPDLNGASKPSMDFILIISVFLFSSTFSPPPALLSPFHVFTHPAATDIWENFLNHAPDRTRVNRQFTPSRTFTRLWTAFCRVSRQVTSI